MASPSPCMGKKVLPFTDGDSLVPDSLLGPHREGPSLAPLDPMTASDKPSHICANWLHAGCRLILAEHTCACGQATSVPQRLCPALRHRPGAVTGFLAQGESGPCRPLSAPVSLWLPPSRLRHTPFPVCEGFSLPGSWPVLREALPTPALLFQVLTAPGPSPEVPTTVCPSTPPVPSAGLQKGRTCVLQSKAAPPVPGLELAPHLSQDRRAVGRGSSLAPQSLGLPDSTPLSPHLPHSLCHFSPLMASSWDQPQIPLP